MTLLCSRNLTQQPAFGGDDIAFPIFGLRTKARRLRWVTLSEQKWVILAERRGLCDGRAGSRPRCCRGCTVSVVPASCSGSIRAPQPIDAQSMDSATRRTVLEPCSALCSVYTRRFLAANSMAALFALFPGSFFCHTARLDRVRSRGQPQETCDARSPETVCPLSSSQEDRRLNEDSHTAIRTAVVRWTPVRGSHSPGKKPASSASFCQGRACGSRLPLRTNEA
jgi:hypothetical protein